MHHPHLHGRYSPKILSLVIIYMKLNIEVTFEDVLPEWSQNRKSPAPCALAHAWVWRLCCSVLQCVAVCSSVMQCVAVWCSVQQCVAVCCSVLQCVAVCCSVMQCDAVCSSVLQCVAVCCSVLQYVVVCDMSTPTLVIQQQWLHRHTARYCKTLQHTLLEHTKVHNPTTIVRSNTITVQECNTLQHATTRCNTPDCSTPLWPSRRAIQWAKSLQ